ncbi:MAG: DUF697 domain-containing protein [Pseudomonadota bacterium]|jgi:hypothetical protein|nr:DUF697 domain-containing protein [Syntrophaceae bacterium]MDI9556466.1 DUF697 domain-containing protein [Pseudomonadota bacterium]NLX31466.1 DUF697 domain-containing protein [Deltaproteobacteria bacterium]HNZ35257.1 DUF697 domain-containing protein [Syntrophales bacterium]HOF73223.1 DUF697 domain-containing protein [Syntrophales bacterium]
MYDTLRNVALAASAVILFFFVLFVVNQTAQVVGLADRVSPAFGTAVLWFLVGLYAALILAASVFFLRLPKPLVPPETEMEPEFSRYLDALRTRLAANPRLKGFDLSDRAGIESALASLGRECDVIIRDSAAAVFVSTAISQSGRLDTVFVLTAHVRMVWRIASIYNQRPALRELVRLYANVAATALVAGELDEAEISEQIEPILSSALGAVSLSVPGMQAAASIVVTSILTGAANAFLTLRVGIIARRWCGSLVVDERRALRRTATAEAARLLGSIVKSGTARISRGLWDASKDKVGGAFSGLTGVARDIKDSILALLKIKKGEE